MEVDVLARAEWVAILLARVPGLARADAGLVAAALGDLPLASAQVASYLVESGMPAGSTWTCWKPCGVPELGHGADLGLLRGSPVLVEEAAEDGPALDPLLGEVGDGVVGPGRAEFAAAVGSLSVVVPGIPGEDRPQVPFTEDQHPVGDLVPGGEHEPFGIGVARIVNYTRSARSVPPRPGGAPVPPAVRPGLRVRRLPAELG